MIAMLRGRLAARSLGEVVVDVGGVGYRVRVPAGMALPGLSEPVVLHTHLAVREDALDLYGFADADTRELFVLLLGVSGFGPRLALAALGTLGAQGLRQAVVREDVGALTVVPGVGKKSAQRLVLELRERLGALAADPVTIGYLDGPGPGPRQEVREALAALGYAPGEVAGVLERLPVEAEATVEQLLRTALRELGTRA